MYTIISRIGVVYYWDRNNSNIMIFGKVKSKLSPVKIIDYIGS